MLDMSAFRTKRGFLANISMFYAKRLKVLEKGNKCLFSGENISRFSCISVFGFVSLQCHPEDKPTFHCHPERNEVQ